MSVNTTNPCINKQYIPVTEAQKEIWLSCQMCKEASCAYNQSFTILLSGTVDTKCLEKAICQVISAHDAFFVNFSHDGKFMIKKEKNVVQKIAILDISSNSHEEQTNLMAIQLSDEVSLPFDLENGPLWRAKIVILSNKNTSIIFTAHHIIFDGWSINVLARQFGACYSALNNNKNYNFDNSETFLSYCMTQKDLLQAIEFEENKKYWTCLYSEPLADLELPLDFPRPPIRTYNALCKKRNINNNLAKKIIQQATYIGISKFSFYLAVFSTLMYRLSKNENIIIGIPAAGQNFANKPALVGHCVNMLPVKIQYQTKQSFTDTAIKIQDSLFDAYEHYNFTFGTLINLLDINRDISRIPLMSVGFTSSEIPSSEELEFSDVEATFTLNDRSFETFEIYATLLECRGNVQFMWQYNSDLFSQETIERWLDEYEVLLENAVNNQSLPITSLPIMTSREQHNVLTDWNATHKEYPFNNTFIDMFTECVKKSPDSKAVECKERSLTYKELDIQSTLIARQLLNMGATTETIVCLCLERSTEMVAGMIGILKSGAAYIPIDPTFPDERISFILNDSNAIGLLTQSDFEHRFSLIKKLPLIFIDKISNPAWLDISSKPLQYTKVNPYNLAYIIYTSGSTGKPKGVEICHRSLTNFLYSMQEKPGITSKDSILSVTTISFDIAGLEILLPLTVGANVQIAENDIQADAQRLSERIISYRPTIMQATPSTWNLLLESGWNYGKGMTILCGGEAMTKTLADKLVATGATVWNMYGPTETTIWSALWRVEPWHSTPPIGYPIENTQLYIVDEDLSPVPIGVAGELCICGLGLARGYHNRPELTQEKFIKNPFAHINNTDETRMYKTGDVAKRLSDGSIIILGRSDFQVKIRGFRIELGEIETILMEDPAIFECIVTDNTDIAGVKILIAYIVTRDKMPLPVDILNFSLKKKLPNYMIPSHFVFLQAIPRLTNGKINRAALPYPDMKHRNLSSIFVTPDNEIEKKLILIWSNVLGKKNISVLDNFFDLGGNSMNVASVRSQIKDKIKRELDMVTLFEHPTIRSLSGYLQKESSNAKILSSIAMRANKQKNVIAHKRRINIQ